jgi:argininosuccinate lyase
MRNSITPQMLATDLALDMARDGVPFREAYRVAAARCEKITDEDIARSIAGRVSPGGCGRLETALLQSRLEALRN